MTGYRKLLFDLEKKESSQNVILGDDARYAVRGTGATSFQLKSGETLKMKEVLHVPRMTSNLVDYQVWKTKVMMFYSPEGESIF